MPPLHDPADPAAGTVTLTAPAKLNLNLRITGRRADGYHLLESAVVFTAFGDRITLRQRNKPAPGGDRLTVTGPFSAAMPSVEADNICLRAVQAFRDAGGACDPLDIHLDKQIPAGAGLGGGSSDAAAILRHLNLASAVPLSAERLATVALGLGADVPVCLAGGAQHMTGIGESLVAIDPAPTGHVVLAKPDIALSTPDVFARFSRSDFSQPSEPGDGTDALTLVALGNDLTAAAVELVPAIAALLAAIAACDGHQAAQMSGSGSACFALFHGLASAQAAAQSLETAGYWAVATEF